MVTDDYSHYCWTTELTTKDQAVEWFTERAMEIHNHIGRHIEVVQSDMEFDFDRNHHFAAFCKAHGILSRTTCARTPEQDGVAECSNLTVMNLVRSVLADTQLAKIYWGEISCTVVYTLNRSPTKGSTVQDKTPFELWTDRRPNVSHLRSIGDIAYAHVDKALRASKLQPHASPWILIGYSTTKKAYRLLNPKTRQFTESRNITFLTRDIKEPPSLLPTQVKIVGEDLSEMTLKEDDTPGTTLPSVGDTPNPVTSDSVGEEPWLEAESQESDTSSERSFDTVPDMPDIPEVPNSRLMTGLDVNNILPHSCRSQMAALATHTITHTPTGWKHIEKPKHGWALNTFIQPEPVSHAAINGRMDSQQWIDAMNEEWNALVANGTFEPID